MEAASIAGIAVATTKTWASAQDATPSSGTTDNPDDPGIELSQDFVEPTQLGDAVPAEFTANETNWPTEHGNIRGTRNALGSTISTETIGTLDVAWRLAVDAPGTYGSMTSTPVIVDDTLYLIDMQSNIWSVNKITGEVNWKKEYNVGLLGPNGLAAAYGRIYGALGDTSEVVAIDQATGDEYFRVKLSNNHSVGIDIAPFVYDNIVYVSTVPGNSKSFYNGGSKGILYGLDADTGATIFEWDTTTDGLWGNFRVNSGGGLWHPPVADDDGNIYFSVANAAPWPGNPTYPNASSRPGNNDYANSLVSLDPIGGRVRWYINVKPHDLFDLDLHLSPILDTLEVNGKERLVVFAAGKLGYVLAADAETGEELWRVPVGTHKNDDLQALTDELVEVWPGNNGGVETPMAYKDGVIFVPVLEMPSYYNSTGYGDPLFNLNDAKGLLIALDAATGATIWSADLPTAEYGGAVVVNDVVFTGGLDGVVRGFNAATGEQIYTFQAGSGLNASTAISGDYLFVPATGPLIPSTDTNTEGLEPKQELIALKVGGSTATPAS